MTKRKNVKLSSGQQLAIRQLREVAGRSSGDVTVFGGPSAASDGSVEIAVRINTSSMTVAAGGLPIQSDHEDFTLVIDSYFPASPPVPKVNHERFVGYAHVLQGERLCVYLDPDREWDPRAGMAGALEQLWDWLSDAAAGEFDARTALYHPVGGVVHATIGTPLLVVRKSLQLLPTKRLRRINLKERSRDRIDLVSWNAGEEDKPNLTGLAVTLDRPLPYGAGTTFGSLLARLQGQEFTLSTLTAALTRMVMAARSGGSQYVLLAVPHGQHADAPAHLVAFRIPAQLSDALRQPSASDPVTGALDPNRVPLDTELEWCTVSDERPEVHTRRDSQRPTATFYGMRVEIWGAGALGSWIADFITRAGAAHVAIRDPGRVTGALLVRQNYEEGDVGSNKADRLAAKVQRTSDTVTTQGLPHTAVAALIVGIPDCDLVIDATINTGVAYYLDQVAGVTSKKPWLARVATDANTATLGLLIASAPDDSRPLEGLDHLAGSAVRTDPALEQYEIFWNPSSGNELIPAPGCSVPTFHGSAADVAGVAGSLLTFLGQQIRSRESGIHLIAMPQAGGHGPAHHYIHTQSVSSL